MGASTSCLQSLASASWSECKINFFHVITRTQAQYRMMLMLSWPAPCLRNLIIMLKCLATIILPALTGPQESMMCQTVTCASCISTNKHTFLYGEAYLEVELVVQVLVDLLGVAVFAQQPPQNPQTPHPQHLGGQTGLPCSLPLTCMHTKMINLQLTAGDLCSFYPAIMSTLIETGPEVRMIHMLVQMLDSIMSCRQDSDPVLKQSQNPASSLLALQMSRQQ